MAQQFAEVSIRANSLVYPGLAPAGIVTFYPLAGMVEPFLHHIADSYHLHVAAPQHCAQVAAAHRPYPNHTHGNPFISRHGRRPRPDPRHAGRC
jgi:hypothetical protein